MIKLKLIFAFFISIYSTYSYAQQVDTLDTEVDTAIVSDKPMVDEYGMEIEPSQSNPFFAKENMLGGLEFSVFTPRGTVFLEAAPFVGISVKEIMWFGAGVHGSVALPLYPGYKSSSIYGAHAFARINIAQSYFIIGEYRLGVGRDLSTINTPRSVQTTPIIGGGYMYGQTAWLYIGYAINPKYAAMAPTGNLTYRFGILFN